MAAQDDSSKAVYREPSEDRRDWDEYLAWVKNAAEGQYEETERRAWVRLQSALLCRRVSNAPKAVPTVDRIIFTPEEGLEVDFEPETE